MAQSSSTPSASPYPGKFPRRRSTPRQIERDDATFVAGAHEQYVAPGVSVAVGDLAGTMWFAIWHSEGHVSDKACAFDVVIGVDFLIDRHCVLCSISPASHRATPGCGTRVCVDFADRDCPLRSRRWATVPRAIETATMLTLDVAREDGRRSAKTSCRL